MPKSTKQEDQYDPNARHNITIADIKKRIGDLFEPLIDRSYGTILNEGFKKRGGSPFNQEHIRAANTFEDEVKHLLKGFKALDECDNKARFERIRESLLNNAEGPLCDAILNFLEKFIDAVYDAVKDDLK